MSRFNTPPDDQAVDLINVLALIDVMVDAADGDEYDAMIQLAKLGTQGGPAGAYGRVAFITMSETLDNDQ